MTQTYYPHPRYALSATLCGLLTALFAWELLGGFAPGAALFCGVALGLTFWNGLGAFSRVEVTTQELTLHTPLRQPRQISFRQLASVSREGRLTTALTLIYHPQQPGGLLDLAAIGALHLPTLLDQDALFTQLEGKVPA